MLSFCLKLINCRSEAVFVLRLGREALIFLGFGANASSARISNNNNKKPTILNRIRRS